MINRVILVESYYFLMQQLFFATFLFIYCHITDSIDIDTLFCEDILLEVRQFFGRNSKKIR